MIKKVTTWAVLIFILSWLATDPSGAASFLHGISDHLKSAAASLADYYNSL